MLDLKTNNRNILFQQALGLQDPWQISKIDFSKEKGRLDIYLSHKTGAKFTCSGCGETLGIHDTQERVWKHLNFFQYETYLYANLPRINCPKCKTTRNVSVPWARPNSGFTLLFEAFALELAQAMPMSLVGEITNENDTRLMRIVTHYVEQAREKVDMSQVSKIGTDETSKAKGHNYITTFIDFKERKALFATEGKDNSTVKCFKEDLEKHNGKAENIEQACCWQGILNFFKDRISNGLTEGINSIIQTIKRRARGYRNTTNFITIIYLVLGKLDFNLPAVTGLATHYR